MALRIITALIGLVVFFVVVLSGTMPLNIGICAVIAIMLYEFYKSQNCCKLCKLTGYISAAVIIACLFTNAGLYTGTLIAISLFLIVMLILHGKVNYKDVFSTGLGTVFITLFMSTLMMIRKEFDIFGTLIVFVCAWTTDSGAYFVGRFCGKHKLIPHVSPKKTVEGAVGGVITSGLCCALYLLIANNINMISADGAGYIGIMILGAAASVFSQLGDLIASAIKRDCGVKDFGNILPGHGGALDRFDSVLFLSPFVYFLLKLII